MAGPVLPLLLALGAYGKQRKQSQLDQLAEQRRKQLDELDLAPREGESPYEALNRRAVAIKTMLGSPNPQDQIAGRVMLSQLQQDSLGLAKDSEAAGDAKAAAERRAAIIGGVNVDSTPKPNDPTSSNSFDLAKMAEMNRQEAEARAWITSGDPELAKAGFTRLNALDSARTGQIQSNETEARADAAQRRSAQIAAMGTSFARDKAFADDIRKDVLEPLNLKRSAYNKVMALLDTKDPLANLGAMTTLIQSFDNSVVNAGDRYNYQGSNGQVAATVDALNKLRGDPMNQQTRQSVRNTVTALFNAEQLTSKAKLSTYEQQVTAFGSDPAKVFSVVPKDFYTPAPVSKDAADPTLTASQVGPIKEVAQPSFGQKASADIIKSYPRTLDPNAPSPGLWGSLVGGAASGSIRSMDEFSIDQARRYIEGKRLVQDASGTFYEQDNRGQLTKVPADMVPKIKAYIQSQGPQDLTWAQKLDRKLQ